MLSIWLSAALLGFCRGHNTQSEGYSLSMSSYHLCPGNQTTRVSREVSYTASYTQWRACGGWLPWSLCEVTLYRTAYRTEHAMVTRETRMCCNGYEQVGSYCALPLNSSGVFTAKPGRCPEQAAPGPSAEGCSWDTDCPGWHKCCPGEGTNHCTNPAPTDSGSRGWSLNVTVTVKTDYSMLLWNRGLLNHTRLLHSVVTGALSSPGVSVFYLRSWPCGPLCTSSSLLLCSRGALALPSASADLRLLLRDIEEVTSVSVEDVDECADPGLHGCSAQATCSNTEGSYNCTCLLGYLDLSLNERGVHCQAPPHTTSMANDTRTQHGDNVTAISVSGTTLLYSPHAAATHSPTAHSAVRGGTSWSWATPAPSTAAPAPGPGLPSTSPPTTQQTLTEAHSSVQPSGHAHNLPPQCYVLLTNLQSSNVNGSSFCVSWTSQSLGSISFQVSLLQGSEVRNSWWTNQTMLEVTGLQPGAVYNVTVTTAGCEGQGSVLQMRVKTAAQILVGKARLTNLEFTKALLDHSSLAYKNLTQSIENEILVSLPEDVRRLVDSDQVRLLITGLAHGSVVVKFTLIFSPSETQDIFNISSAFLASLQNSSVYTVDMNSSRIEDYDECAAGDTDCSPWANCNNTEGSYSCVCRHGFTNTNSSREGRDCQESLTTATPTSLMTTPSPSRTTFNPVTQTTSTNSTTTPPATAAYSLTVTTATISSVTTSASTAIPVKITSTTKGTLNSTTPASTSPSTPASTRASTPASTPASTTPASTPASTTAPASSRGTSRPLTLAPLVASGASISMVCGAGTIWVAVARPLLAECQISASALYLGLPECGVDGGNASHVFLTTALDRCDTVILNNNTHFTAQVTLLSSRTPDASVPAVRLAVPIMCTYIKSLLISTGYGPSGYSTIQDTIMGSGMFHLTLKLLNGTHPLPQNYSLGPNQEAVVEVSVNSTVEQIKVVINRCWATPTSNSADNDQYIFLENSCPVPNAFTTVLENGNSSTARVSVRIFSFVRLNVMYLHCQIQICMETSSSSCKPDCIERTERFSNLIGTAKASCGPFLRSEEKTTPEDDGMLQLVGFSLLGVGVTLIFLGSFICILYYHRNKIGHYNFSVKPKPENFTYNVFDA